MNSLKGNKNWLSRLIIWTGVIMFFYLVAGQQEWRHALLFLKILILTGSVLVLLSVVIKSKFSPWMKGGLVVLILSYALLISDAHLFTNFFEFPSLTFVRFLDYIGLSCSLGMDGLGCAFIVFFLVDYLIAPIFAFAVGSLIGLMIGKWKIGTPRRTALRG